MKNKYDNTFQQWFNFNKKSFKICRLYILIMYFFLLLKLKQKHDFILYNSKIQLNRPNQTKCCGTMDCKIWVSHKKNLKLCTRFCIYFITKQERTLIQSKLIHGRNPFSFLMHNLTLCFAVGLGFDRIHLMLKHDLFKVFCCPLYVKPIGDHNSVKADQSKNSFLYSQLNNVFYHR